MKAILITYSAKGLSKTESSKLSKALIGYLDSSNNAKYTYKRKGLVTSVNNIIVSKSTFIVPRNKIQRLISYIESRGAKVLSWDIDIPRKYFKG